jgi:hypothetical protein
MTFERTAHGQQNRALFLDVDYVCYVEGASGAEEGDDIAFWAAVFEMLRPDIKVHFVCRGGKPVLERLAREVIVDDMTSVLVAMDADYSRMFPGQFISDHRILYTYGYSWENDVYHEGHGIGVYRRIARRSSIPASVKDFYVEGWERFRKQAHRLMMADFFGLAAHTSVIPRQSPGRLVDRDGDGRPFVVKRQCLLLTAAGNCAPCRRPIKDYDHRPDCAKRYLVGKVLELAARYLMNACISRFSGGRAATELQFRQLALWTFEAALASSKRSVVLNHHRQQMAAV